MLQAGSSAWAAPSSRHTPSQPALPPSSALLLCSCRCTASWSWCCCTLAYASAPPTLSPWASSAPWCPSPCSPQRWVRMGLRCGEQLLNVWLPRLLLTSTPPVPCLIACRCPSPPGRWCTCRWQSPSPPPGSRARCLGWALARCLPCSGHCWCAAELTSHPPARCFLPSPPGPFHTQGWVYSILYVLFENAMGTVKLWAVITGALLRQGRGMSELVAFECRATSSLAAQPLPLQPAI